MLKLPLKLSDILMTHKNKFINLGSELMVVHVLWKKEVKAFFIAHDLWYGERNACFIDSARKTDTNNVIICMFIAKKVGI